jgi:hypothetical protein
MLTASQSVTDRTRNARNQTGLLTSAYRFGREYRDPVDLRVLPLWNRGGSRRAPILGPAAEIGASMASNDSRSFKAAGKEFSASEVEILLTATA